MPKPRLFRAPQTDIFPNHRRAGANTERGGRPENAADRARTARRLPAKGPARPEPIHIGSTGSPPSACASAFLDVLPKTDSGEITRPRRSGKSPAGKKAPLELPPLKGDKAHMPRRQLKPTHRKVGRPQDNLLAGAWPENKGAAEISKATRPESD